MNLNYCILLGHIFIFINKVHLGSNILNHFMHVGQKKWLSFKLGHCQVKLMDFSKLEVCVQLSINEVGGGCLNMCLVYWAALVNMGSMLTGDMNVRIVSKKDLTAFVALCLVSVCLNLTLNT